MKLTPLSESRAKKSTSVSIPIVAPTGEAVIYRNFIAGTDARGIGVGYSQGVNLAFSADSLSLDMIWKGKFIDGGRHWTNRGQGFEQPAGEQVTTLNRGLSFALLESQTTSWPTEANPKFQPSFKGYSLNKKQEPSFTYHFGAISIEDSPTPSPEGFTRTLSIVVPSNGAPEKQVYFRALSGKKIQSNGDRSFTFDGKLSVKVPSSEQAPFTRKEELLIPIPLTPGTHTITLEYTWK